MSCHCKVQCISNCISFKSDDPQKSQMVQHGFPISIGNHSAAEIREQVEKSQIAFCTIMSLPLAQSNHDLNNEILKVNQMIYWLDMWFFAMHRLVPRISKEICVSFKYYDISDWLSWPASSRICYWRNSGRRESVPKEPALFSIQAFYNRWMENDQRCNGHDTGKGHQNQCDRTWSTERH